MDVLQEERSNPKKVENDCMYEEHTERARKRGRDEHEPEKTVRVTNRVQLPLVLRATPYSIPHIRYLLE